MQAERAVLPGRLPGQEVGEVENHACPAPSPGKAPLQPHQLGDLHFRRDHAAVSGHHLVPGRGALGGLGLCPMIQPEQGVPAALPSLRDRERLARPVAHHQRAGRIEGDAGDRLGRRGRLGARGAHGGAGRRPNLLAVLLGLVRGGSIEFDGRLGAAKHAARSVEDAGARAAGTDVDRRDEIPHASPNAQTEPSRSRMSVIVQSGPRAAMRSR